MSKEQKKNWSKLIKDNNIKNKQENEEEFPASRADIWGPSDFDAKPPKVREEINV